MKDMRSRVFALALMVSGLACIRASFDWPEGRLTLDLVAGLSFAGAIVVLIISRKKSN
jgi:hypothetical protein